MKRTSLARKTPLRRRSPKREAYMASAERKDGVAHMLAVKALPCICCGHPPPSEAHHCRSGGMARDDLKTIPLCYEHHRGVTGYHLNKAEWEAKYGPDHGLLEKVQAMLSPP